MTVKLVSREEIQKHWEISSIPISWLFYKHTLGAAQCYIQCKENGLVDWNTTSIYPIEELIEMNNIKIFKD